MVMGFGLDLDLAVNRCQLENLELLLALGSPDFGNVADFFPINPRPIGEVVEILPLGTSLSSDVTRRYLISAPLLTS